MIAITDMAEYNLCIQRGYQPLVNERFAIPIRLRIEIQNIIYHTTNRNNAGKKKAMHAFYRWVWRVKPHVCEECGKPLGDYSAVHISHILTRGSHPDMAADPRNTNVLCFEHHRHWETGKRKTMRIYLKNQIIIKKLMEEYEQCTKEQF